MGSSISRSLGSCYDQCHFLDCKVLGKHSVDVSYRSTLRCLDFLINCDNHSINSTLTGPKKINTLHSGANTLLVEPFIP